MAVPARVNYQGSLESDGMPVTATVTMIFRIYTTSTGGTPLWEEEQDVAVADGIFHIALGTGLLNPAYGSLDSAVQGNDDLWLEVLIGGEVEPMIPRQPLASEPFAIRAGTVSDGVITQAKLADAAVTTAKLADGAVTTDKVSGGSGSGLDADLLDGNDATAFAAVVHHHDTLYYSKTQVDALVSDLQAQIDVLRGHSCTDDDGDGFYGQGECTTAIDCDDSIATIHPGAAEICGDAIDNNCDGQVDEGCVVDADDDGYDSTVDCDDTDPDIHPGALDICDELDNDCDGQYDEDCVPLVINEIDYDQPGTDMYDFVEIYNASDAAVDLGLAELVLINGSTMTPYLTIPLGTAGILPAYGYLVVGSPLMGSIPGALFLSLPTGDSLQNGPDGVQLVGQGVILDSVAYEGDVAGCTEGTVMAAIDIGEGTVGRVNGLDTNNNDVDFQHFVISTPGTANM